jgi:iron complex outermembrane receptor protein
VPGLDRLGGPWVTPSHDFLIDQADTCAPSTARRRAACRTTRPALFDQRERNATLYLQGRWKTKLGGIDVNGDAAGATCASTAAARQ